MKKTVKKLTVSALAAALILSSTVTASAAIEKSANEDSVTYSQQERAAAPALKLPASRSISSYPSATVKRGTAVMSRDAFMLGDTVYVGLRSFASAIGASVKYTASTKTSVMTMNGLTLSVTDGCFTVYANSRPLFSLNGAVLMNNGKMYLPIEHLSKAVGLRLSVSGRTATLSGSVAPLMSAERYYREDEVLWLARIIHAESRGEPLIGQIAVGNVVLNRVRSKDYPNTIYGVIFDRKYGVQFSPILDGSIYNTPCYTCVLAAKICLEGFDLSEGALFFLEPEHSTSSWIPKNRPFLFSIGAHDFYS